MRAAIVAIAVAVVLAAQGCGGAVTPERAPGAETSRAAIVNGQADGPLHPNVGALVRPWPTRTSPFAARCSGVLVAPDVFVTAGHCAANFTSAGYGNHGDFGVAFDSVIDPSVGASRVYFGTFHRHPLNVATGFLADVAVVKLDAPVEGITPAKLAQKELLTKLAPETLETLRFVGVGYGTDDFALEPRGVRRFGSHRFLGLYGAAEEEGLGFDNFVMFGGVYADGVATSSYGDSGGPHFVGDSDTVVAITSLVDWGTPESALEYAQRVDLKDVRKFILSFSEAPED